MAKLTLFSHKRLPLTPSYLTSYWASFVLSFTRLQLRWYHCTNVSGKFSKHLEIGKAVECVADRERELTGRLQHHCLYLIICHQAILPQQFGPATSTVYSTASIWLYVVLSRSDEHSRLAVSRVDSHWKAITEGASQKSFLVCKFKRVQLVGLQHQHEPRLWKCKLISVSDKSDITVYGPAPLLSQSCPVSSWSVILSLRLGSVCRLHTPANPA